MARILPDRDIRRLIGTVIIDGDDRRINPNGIELRVGKHAYFQSTREERDLHANQFLKVLPGESVTITSLEQIDFTREAVHKIFPQCDLMAMITPTTSMMREGIMQTSTKIDAGFKGVLNWSFRNSSIQDFILGFGEAIFKLTFHLLEKDETPETLYGERAGDRYQNTNGIVHSTRKVPASLSKKQIVASSAEKLDPSKQLKEAGFPFNYISNELTEIQGQFEVVSKDVLLLKTTIGDEAAKLSNKVDESQKSTLEKVEFLFDRKFLSIAGSIAGCLTMMFALITFLQTKGITGVALSSVAFFAGCGIFWVVDLLARKKSKNSAAR